METKVKQKVFEFQELDEETQKELIENHRDDEVDSHYWFECTLEHWKDKLEQLGFLDPNIQFSGFNSQGDGACFSANIDLETYLPAHRLKTKMKPLLNAEEVEFVIKIYHDSRYCYATSTDVNVEMLYYGENTFKAIIIDVLVDKLEKHINDEREKLGNIMYKELQEEYEMLTSDEYVRGRLCELNFNKLGGIINE